jgi:2-methylisocitrate lyase-like PEP mutase family enzyme
MDQSKKAAHFEALHGRPGAFVIPNPWDAGSARILSSMGFEALATTSAGLAFSLGRRDAEGALTRDDILTNAKAIVDATDLPVSADLENGFGHSPEEVAETIRRAASVGLVGGSIEDATGSPDKPIYDFGHAVERIAAAAEAARGLPFRFMVVARCENFSVKRDDLDDTIRRLQAFERAGADVLYAPALPDLDAIRTVCASVGKPVNVVMGFGGGLYPVQTLADAGVKRISVGGSFARAALAGLARAAREVRDHGTFAYVEEAMPFSEANGYMAPASREPESGG